VSLILELTITISRLICDCADRAKDHG